MPGNPAISCISVIPDGNRRWGKKNLLSMEETYRFAAGKTWDLLEWAAALKSLKRLNFFLFSKSNLKREKKDLSAIIQAVDSELEKALKSGFFREKKLKIRFFGDRAVFGEKILKKFDLLEKMTQKNKGLEIVFFIGYSSQEEIIETAKKAAGKKKERKGIFSAHLPVDIVARTGGEKRLSDFLLLEHMDAELFFIEKPWPELEKKDLEKAINEFFERKKVLSDF